MSNLNHDNVDLDHSSTALDDALRHLRADHEAVMIEQDGRVIAVLVPPEEYLPVRDADIPAEFWQGLRESKAGIGVDMETALNERGNHPWYLRRHVEAGCDRLTV